MKPEELAQFDGPDDPTLKDDEQMWRRISPRWIVHDDKYPPVASRLSGQAFEESKKPPSPCSLIRAIESTPEKVQKSAEYSVGAIRAGVVRSRGFKLVRHEEPDEPGHYHMVGANDKKRQYEVRQLLAEVTEWVIGRKWGIGIAPPLGQ